MDRSRAKLARKLRLLEELKWILMFTCAVYVVILLLTAKKAPPIVSRLLIKKFKIFGGYNETEGDEHLQRGDNEDNILHVEKGYHDDHDKKKILVVDEEVEGVEKVLVTVFQVLYLSFAAIQAFGIVGAWREKYRTTGTFIFVHFLTMITSWTLLFTSKCLWTVLNAAWTLIIAAFGCVFLWNLYIKRLIVKGADGDVNFDELW